MKCASYVYAHKIITYAEAEVQKVFQNRPVGYVPGDMNVHDMLELLRARYMEENDLLQDELGHEKNNFCQCRLDSTERYQEINVNMKKIEDRASRIVGAATNKFLSSIFDFAEQTEHIINVLKTKLLDYIEDVIYFSGESVSFIAA